MMTIARTTTAPRLTANEMTTQLLLRVPAEIPGVRCWRVNVICARTASGRMVRSGIPGAADITGISPTGQRIEIEVKAGRDRLAPQQRSFLAMINERGGIGIVARDVDAAIAELRARCGA